MKPTKDNIESVISRMSTAEIGRLLLRRAMDTDPGAVVGIVEEAQAHQKAAFAMKGLFCQLERRIGSERMMDVLSSL
jgi:hypothetical protein